MTENRCSSTLKIKFQRPQPKQARGRLILLIADVEGQFCRQEQCKHENASLKIEAIFTVAPPPKKLICLIQFVFHTVKRLFYFI